MRHAPFALAAVLLTAATASALLPAGPLPPGVLPPLPHPPIDIDGDGDLCGDPLSGVTNCLLADGTAAKPYEIVGWSVETGSGDARPAFRLTNTTKHVLVRFNVLATDPSSTTPLAVLTNVANVRFESNVLEAGAAPALVANGLAGGVLASNTLQSAAESGAFALAVVRNAPGVTITSNALSAPSPARGHVTDLLVLNASSDARLEDNTYASTTGTAVRLEDSARAALLGEAIEDAGTGIVLARSSSASISDSALDTVGGGILANASGSLTLVNVAIRDDFPCEPTCAFVDGVRLLSTSLTARNVTVDGFEVGVIAAAPAGRMDMRYMNVTANGIGYLVLAHKASALRWSNVQGNSYGVKNFDASTDPDPPVDATNVWWGCATGPGTPGCDTVFGRVNFTPFRTTPVG